MHAGHPRDLAALKSAAFATRDSAQARERRNFWIV
jgi:hypothetical protein